MSTQGGDIELSTGERWLGRWMIGVAVFHLFSFANFVWLRLDPTLLETLYPAYDVPTTSVAAQTTIDSLFMFGVEIAVVGVVYLVIIVTGYLAYRNATKTNEPTRTGGRSV